jgi:SNF2 family DNA or RNA helicase
MLRRRKSEVEGELPGRTVNYYFVQLEPEQRRRYNEYEEMVARLAAKTRTRPWTKEEWDKMQRWLACMCMLCDTPYILDDDCRLSPRLEELEAILDGLLGADGDH